MRKFDCFCQEVKVEVVKPFLMWMALEQSYVHKELTDVRKRFQSHANFTHCLCMVKLQTANRHCIQDVTFCSCHTRFTTGHMIDHLPVIHQVHMVSKVAASSYVEQACCQN